MDKYLRSVICSYAQTNISVENFNKRMLTLFQNHTQKIVEELIKEGGIIIENNTLQFRGESLIIK